MTLLPEKQKKCLFSQNKRSKVIIRSSHTTFTRGVNNRIQTCKSGAKGMRTDADEDGRSCSELETNPDRAGMAGRFKSICIYLPFPSIYLSSIHLSLCVCVFICVIVLFCDCVRVDSPNPRPRRVNCHQQRKLISSITTSKPTHSALSLKR